ncbi:MAG: ammonium transporter [Actinobacteria bacterium]|nr:MAG: ammonium transporter [Actinomycetota bacterium]TMM14538.1 MAG: ammonium transporter [Actinomycetota bacterium]
MWSAYPNWLNPGDNAWQLTAATLVGLMSVPGLVVLYGGVMQKRWSVNSMMMSFIAFALVLIAWVLVGFEMAFGHPLHIFGAHHGFFANMIGIPRDILGHVGEQGQASIPLITTGPPFHFPTATLAYFQFVFAAITPILMLGSVLGRINFKAWIPFVVLWSTLIYTVNAFLIWGGGWWAQHGAVDYSGGYVIHLAAGVSGFVAAAVIGPRLRRDREVDAPNNLLMVATGAGLLWLGWNGFNGGDPYYAGADAAAAVLNTNLCTAVAFLVWIGWDYATGRKPSLIGSVNAMITGLVAITPAAGYVNGWGAGAIGIAGSTLVYFAYNYVSRLRPFRRVDDTLGVVYTHGFAGLAGGLLTGFFADPKMIVYLGIGKTAPISVAGVIHGHAVLLKWQAIAALWVILFSGIGTFLLLKLVGLFVPLRMKERDMEEGDLAVHGHEVYPSDVPSLSFPSGTPAPPPAARPAEAPG